MSVKNVQTVYLLIIDCLIYHILKPELLFRRRIDLYTAIKNLRDNETGQRGYLILTLVAIVGRSHTVESN